MVTSNASYWPAVDNAATSRGSPRTLSPFIPTLCSGSRRRRRHHPFSPILFHARFSLSSPTLFPTTRRYTTRVFNLVHLIVGFVGAFVRATCSNLGLSTTIDNVVTIAATRTLLSSYVNELLIFRASDFFFFFVSSSSSPQSSSSSSSSSSSPFPLLIHRLLHHPSGRRAFIISSSSVSLARTTRTGDVCRYKAGINFSSSIARLSPFPSRYPTFGGSFVVIMIVVVVVDDTYDRV